MVVTVPGTRPLDRSEALILGAVTRPVFIHLGHRLVSQWKLGTQTRTESSWGEVTHWACTPVGSPSEKRGSHRGWTILEWGLLTGKA